MATAKQKQKPQEPATPKVSLEASQVRTVIKIMVGTDVTKEQAVALREQLEKLYEEDYDKGDEGLYEKLGDLMERALLKGDFNIDTPEFMIYAGNNTQIA